MHLFDRLLSPVAATARHLLAGPGRSVWRSDTRVHIEVPGARRPGTEEAVRRLERRLGELAGVRRAEGNGVLGRIVVDHDPDQTGIGELIRVVEEAERAGGLDPGDAERVWASHPADPLPWLHELVALGTGTVGLGYVLARQVLPIRPFPPVLPALLSLVDSTPLLRAQVEARLPRSVVDTFFAVGGSAAHALARQPIALIAVLCHRICLAREVRARTTAWQQWESSLLPGAHQAPPLNLPPRPTALPDGLVERTTNWSAVLALGGYGGMLVTGWSPQRALGVLHAGVPRAAKVGRDCFAAQLDTDLSSRGGIVLDHDVLRRLDRVDTVVLDKSVLLTGRRVIADVVPLDPAADRAELIERAHDLIDLRQPETRRKGKGWVVEPLTDPADELPEAVATTAAEQISRGAVLLAMRHQDRLVGLVSIIAELDPLAEALVCAARAAGSVLLGGSRRGLVQRLRLDGALPGGTRLSAAVRRAQGEGHTVVVVSNRNDAALAAADIGIGLATQAAPAGAKPEAQPVGTARVPWGAHVLCADPAQVCLLLAGVEPARTASSHAAQLSLAGSAVGALLAALGPATGAATRASFPVNFAALLATATGTWIGTVPGRRPAPVPVDRTPWHAMSPEAVLAELDSSGEGLGAADGAGRLRAQPAEDGVQPIGLARASMEELANPLTPALAGGAGVSASIGAVIDAVMISAVLALNALIGGAQRTRTDRALRRLTHRTAASVRVRRNGTAATVDAATLVPGDVIELQAGEAVPADSRLIEAIGLELDESSLTGESALVVKSVRATAAPTLADRHSMLYQGSVVAAGQATGVVVATGGRTEAGRAAQARGDERSGGVQTRLQKLTKVTLPISIGAGAVLMVVDLLRGHPVSQALGRAVSLAVASVPEGLPFVATVAELAAAHRLSARGALARNPSTIEALGRVDILCFDKTGTLTEGRISLRQVSDGRDWQTVEELTPWLRQVLATAVRASPWQAQQDRVPHQTDRAVLAGARRAGVSADDGFDDVQPVDELQFEPSRGYHAALWQYRSGYRMSVKGGPESVLSRCTSWRTPDGEVQLDPAAREMINDEVDRLARQGYRVLAIAERGASQRPELDESRIAKLEFCGLLALADPIRPTAAESVRRLQSAGVEIMMITGDHPATAESIAAELGLSGTRVITGAELDDLDDEQLATVLPGTAVFARSSPEQKARIVRVLRQQGRVVAVTGDGANDAPAIRLADIGMALGTEATPAAREAADLVVTDDRIETITAAIVEGRGMWSSVRDALAILLGGNLGEIAFTVGTGLVSAQEALNARQLLLVNLLTDVLPAMAVAVRPPPDRSAEELLAEGPDVSLGAALTNDMYLRAGTTASAAGVAWLLTRATGTPGQAGTTALVALVGAQLGQTIAMRGRTKLMVAAGAGSLLTLGFVVAVPGVSHFFGCRPLLPHQWAIGLGAAAAATGVALLVQ